MQSELASAPRAIRLCDGYGAPLICLHASDGFAAAYRPLAEGLAGIRPVLGLDAPGLQPGEEPCDSLATLVQAHRASLEPTPAGGHHLLGWSMGAHAAWQLAQVLLAAGEPVARLILIDPAPRAPFAEIRTPSNLLFACADDAMLESLAAGGLDAARIDALPEAERRHLWRGLLQKQGMPASLLGDDAALARFLGVLSANLRAMVNANLMPLPQELDIVVFMASKRPIAWGAPLADWEALLAGRAEPVPIQTDHWSILSAPELMRRIRELSA